MRIFHWLFCDGPIWLTGLLLGLLFLAINFGFGVRIHPYVYFVAIGLFVLAWIALTFIAQGVRFALTNENRREKRLRVLETNFGRYGEWIVERNGKPIARLSEPRWEDMFWFSYAVKPLLDEPVERGRMLSDLSWWFGPGIEYRSREFECQAPAAIASGRFDMDPIRIMMRGLYVPAPMPNLWEGFWLKFVRAKE